MDNVYVVALYALVVLGVLVLLLSAYAVLTRWLSDRRQTRAAQLRPRMRKALEDFLDRGVPIGDTEDALAVDRKLALGMLLGIASTRNREQRARLRLLSDRFGFEDEQLQVLAHRNPVGRARAAVHLGYLGSERAVPGLMQALEDEHLDVRLAAAQALVQLHHAEAVAPILRALALPGRWPLQRATELLYGFGESAVPPLQQVLAARDEPMPPATLAVAITVLGMLGARGAAGDVAAWLGHDDNEVRVAAARALGGMDEPDAVPALVGALRDPAWEVRSMAAKSLGHLSATEAIPALDQVLSDPAWWVRYNAAQALARLGADGLGALRRALATHDDAFARDISRQMLEERSLPPAQEAAPR